MIYLNILTEKRTIEFIDKATTIPIDDIRVAPFFQNVPTTADGIGYKRGKDSNNIPLFEKYVVGINGEFFTNYLAIPDANGIYQPDTTAMDNETKTKRVSEIDTRLDEIDRLTIRSLRSANLGRGNQQDTDTMTALDDEAELLRQERITLI